MEQSGAAPPNLKIQEGGSGLLSTLCYGLYDWLHQLVQDVLHGRLVPLKYSLATYREMVGWDEAPFRCVVLHPTGVQMALISCLDIVQLFEDGHSTQLQSKGQVHLYCAAFRPYTSPELAVGCAAGIYIWQRGRNNLWAHRLLSYTKHIHVTSVQWNQEGTVLASVALGSRHIIVWDPDSGQTIRLLRSSASFLLYSPDFTMLFGAASRSGASVCYVYGASWQLEHFLKGRPIQTAAWTACSNYLLFVQKGDTTLYSTTRNSEAGVFLKPDNFWNLEVVSDLQKVSLKGQQLDHGQPQAIAVDPSGVYLAVIYKKQPFVLLFKLSIPKYSKPRISPLKYIGCDENPATNVYPTCMCLGQAMDDTQCLAICWTSGHFQKKLLKEGTLQKEE